MPTLRSAVTPSKGASRTEDSPAFRPSSKLKIPTTTRILRPRIPSPEKPDILNSAKKRRASPELMPVSTRTLRVRNVTPEKRDREQPASTRSLRKRKASPEEAIVREKKPRRDASKRPHTDVKVVEKKRIIPSRRLSAIQQNRVPTPKKNIPMKSKEEGQWAYPCREKEFDAILSFVEDRIKRSTGG